MHSGWLVQVGRLPDLSGQNSLLHKVASTLLGYFLSKNDLDWILNTIWLNAVYFGLLIYPSYSASST